jgi:hypothetical protein
VRAFLAQQHDLQAEVLDSLRADPHYAADSAPDAVARNRRLVAVWDALSLALCGGRGDRRQVGGVPTAEGETALSLMPDVHDPTRCVVAPWPFGNEAVALRFEGRRLTGQFADQAAMRAALASAPWLSFEVRLLPAAAPGSPSPPQSGPET